MPAPREAAVLGPLERRIMDQLWSAGPATVGATRDALNSTGSHQLAYTTVMTVLVRLSQKGYVTRTQEGSHYRYAAAFEEAALPAAVGRRELRRLIERHGAESLAGFAADLAGVDSEITTRLRELARLDEKRKP
jgi:predicted transcriptional regulator